LPRKSHHQLTVKWGNTQSKVLQESILLLVPFNPFFNDLDGRVYALNLQAERSSKHLRQQDQLAFKPENTVGEGT